MFLVAEWQTPVTVSGLYQWLIHYAETYSFWLKTKPCSSCRGGMLFMSTTCKLERYLNPLKHPHTLMFASLPSRAWDTLSTIPTIIVWVLAFHPKVVGQFYGVPWKKGGWRILKRNTNWGYPLNGQHPHPVQAGSTILQPYCFTLINLLSSYFSWNPPSPIWAQCQYLRCWLM